MLLLFIFGKYPKASSLYISKFPTLKILKLNSSLRQLTKAICPLLVPHNGT